jgi:hypothetical protein
MYVWERCPTVSDSQIHLLWPYSSLIIYVHVLLYRIDADGLMRVCMGECPESAYTDTGASTGAESTENMKFM